MKIDLSIIQKANIFKPDDIYISSPWRDRGLSPDPIEFMYFVRSEEEVLPAFELETQHLEEYKGVEFLGCERITDTCIEFRFSYLESEEGRAAHTFYLHRVRTVQEAMKEAFRE